jgi:hypothetical protein
LNSLETSSGSIRTDFNSYTSSTNSRLNSIEISTGSLNTYTSSNNTVIGTLQVSTGSLNTFTSSANSRLNTIESTTGSLNTFTSSANNRLNSLESASSSIRSDFNTYTSSNNTRVNLIETSTGSLNSFTSSATNRLSSLETASGSIRTDFNTYTSSANGRLTSIEGKTGSITLLNTYTGSNNTVIGTLQTATSSLNTYTSSTNTRLGTIETSTSSLNSFTSSINTTIKNKLNSDGVISGSAQVTISSTTGYSTFSSSLATTDLNQETRLNSIEGKTGSYATTGSNSFIGIQNITGSLYISQDLIVYGSSSMTYVTSSQLNVDVSYISVNVNEPSERFGGLKVYDSGSSNATASLAWDSLNNRWVYQNASGSNYSGAMLIMGPRNTGSLGDEVALTSGRIPKSVGGDHIDNSVMSETNGSIGISGSLVVTGSINASGTVYGTNITLIETATSSLNSYTSSNNTVIGTLQTATSSLNSYTSSTNTRLGVIEGTTSSLNTFTSSANGRLNSLESASSSIRTDFNTFTSSNNTTETTQNNRLTAIETTTGSLNTYTSSNNTVIGTLQVSTGSLNTFTSSTNTRLGLIETSTGSLNTFTSSANGRLNSLESASGSIRSDFNTFTSSNNTTETTQNNRLTSIETSTGSLNSYTSSNTTNITAIHTATSSLNTFTSSAGSRLTSIESTTSSFSGRLSSIETSTGSLNSYTTSQNTHNSAVNTATSSLNSYTSSNTTNITAIHTATSSLNNYTSSQNTHNSAVNTTTSSLLTFSSSVASGLQFTSSNVTVVGNLLVKGTTTTINSTTIDIADNIIQLNGTGTSNGGLVVRDATAATLISGSLLWDTTNDKWIAGPLGSEDDVVLRTATQTLTNKTISGASNTLSNIGNSSLTNSSITIAGTSTSLGGSITAATILTSTGVWSGSAQLPSGTVSGSAQVSITGTTGYDANKYVDHTAVSISTGFGLSGGGTIAATRTLSVDTTGVASVSGSQTLTNKTISGASNTLSNIGNASLTNSSITIAGTSTALGGSITAATILTSTGVWSGSAQLPSGTVSGSSQVLAGTTIHSGSFFNGISVVSGSAQITFSGLSGVPSGLVSGSSQVLVGTTIHSGSFFNGISVVSGSAQIAISGTSDYSTYDATLLKLSGDQTITGQKTFPSAIGNRPILSGGFISALTGDTNTDIWGISEDYYPSHGTAANAWGIRWSGDTNDLHFVGGGTNRVVIDFDNGNITSTGTVSGTTIYGTWNGTAIGNAYLANSSVTVTAGTGMSGGGAVSLGSSITLTNAGVTSIAGTSNQVTASTSTGAVTLSLPQNIHTSASPTFAGLALGDGVYTYSDTNRDMGAAAYYPNAWTRGFRFAFATSSSTSMGGNYAGVLHLHPWDGTTSSTGDASYQFAFGSTASNGSGMPQLRLRKGIDTTWNSWYTVPIKVTASFSSASSVSVTHNLNSKDVLVMCYDSSDNMFWPSSIVTTSVNVVDITFTTSRSGRVVIIG